MPEDVELIIDADVEPCVVEETTLVVELLVVPVPVLVVVAPFPPPPEPTT